MVKKIKIEYLKNNCKRITTTLNSRSLMDQINDITVASEKVAMQRLYDSNRLDITPEDLADLPATRYKNFDIGKYSLMRKELEERIQARKEIKKQNEIKERREKAALKKDSTNQSNQESVKNEAKPNEKTTDSNVNTVNKQ